MPRAKASTTKAKKEGIIAPLTELLGKIENDDIKLKQVPSNLKKFTLDFSSKLKQNVTELTANLNASVDDIISQIDHVSNSLTELYNIKTKQEQLWIREKEEYDYQLKRKRQAANDSWEIEKAKRLQAIEQKEKELSESEAELKDLRNKDKMFEARLSKAVNDAVASAEEKLSQEFAHTSALVASQTDSQKLLLESKNEGLAKLVSNYQVEIERLNKQIDSANARLTEIASGAVRSFKTNQSGKDGSTE